MPKAPDDSEALKAFGKRLRFLRSIENLTQSDLAERAGISFEHVNKLERGASGPSFAVVCALARALGTQPASLFLFSDQDSGEPLHEVERTPAPPSADAPPSPQQGLDWTQFISHCGYWEIHLDTGEEIWSPGFYNLLGYAQGEVSADHVIFLEQHLPPEVQQEGSKRWQRLLQGDRLDDMEVTFLRKDGEARLGWCHSDVERDASGAPLLARGVLIDFTELKRLEGFLLQNQAKLEDIVRMRTAHRDQVIRELEEKNKETRSKAVALEEVLDKYEETFTRYKTLYHYAPVGFLTLDSLGIIQEANAAAAAMLRCEGDQLVGADLETCVDIPDWNLGQVLEDVFENDNSVAFEAQTRPEEDAATRHILLHLAPTVMEEGRQVCLTSLTDISERKWAEQALAEITEYYRIMVEESGDAICIIGKGPQGAAPQFIYANSVFFEFLGLDPYAVETPDFATFLQRIHPEDRDLVQRHALDRLAGKNPPQRYEFRLDTRPLQWIEVYAGRIEVNGQVGTLGGFRDITHRKRAETLLQEKQEHLKAIYNAIPFYTGIWRCVDGDFVLEDVNKSIEDLNAGIRRRIGSLASEFYKDNPAMLQALQQCLADGSRVQQSLPYTFSDGTKRHLHVNLVPLQPDRILLMAEDITSRQREQVQRELELRRLEALFELTSMQHRPLREIMFHALEQCVALTGSEYGYVYLMDRREQRLQLFAWSEKAIRDCKVAAPRRAYQVCDTGLWGEAVRQRKPMITNDYTASPYRQGVPEGHVPLLRHCNVPVLQGERIMAVVGVANKAEDYSVIDVRVLELLMERVVMLWEEKKNNARLRAAKMHAEQANRNKSKYLADMSHEIRTPLNGVLGMLHLLSRSQLEEQQREHLQLAREAGKSLMGIISDVLDFSKIESGRFAFSPEPCDPRRLMERICSLFKEQAQSKGLAFDLQLGPDLPPSLLLDPLRLEQIASNLLSNAVKFTEQGRISLRLDMARSEQGGQELLLEVADTGRGISEELRGRLFEPFSRDEASGQRVPGTGLGLSIVKQLLQRFGGSISVTSSKGVGSVFTCRWPVTTPQKGQHQETEPADYATALEEPEMALQKQPVSEYGATGQETPFRVLVADDDPLSLRVLQELLLRHGCEVQAASDGHEALRLASGNPFDLVFLDIQMPGLDGVEVLQRIRDGECPACQTDVPVVALTAFAMSGDRQSFLEQGMDAYLSKPFEVDDVLQIVDSMARMQR